MVTCLAPFPLLRFSCHHNVHSQGPGECHWMLFLLLIFVHFRPNFTPHSLPHLSPLCLSSLCSSFYAFHTHEQTTRTHSLVRLDTEQLVYWATDIPKQSSCGSSSPGSCAGTSSAATECSHHSKFQTSRTQSMSRSASTA